MILDWHYTPYSLPSLLAALIALAAGWVAWRRQQAAAGSGYFVLFCLSVFLWTFTYGLEVITADLAGKLVWTRLQYIGIVSAPVFWFCFLTRFAGYGNWLTRRNQLLLAFIPVLTLLSVWTTPLHQLHYRSVFIQTEGALFPVLHLEYGITFWVMWIYINLLLVVSTVLLFRVARRSRSLYSKQAVSLLVAMGLVWLTNLTSLLFRLLGVPLVGGINLTPIGFALAGASVGWGLFGLRVLDITPAAFDLVFKQLPGVGFVLDPDGLIIDANPTAEFLTGQTIADMIGRPIQEVFPGEDDLFDDLPSLVGRQIEILIGKGLARCYLVNVSTLEQRGQVSGYVATLHDITKRRIAEDRLRDSEERYRVLADSATDLVTRLTPEGIITYISPSVTAMLGYDQSDLLARLVFDYYHPDDLDAIRRAFSGEADQPDVTSNDVRFRRKDDVYTWLESTSRIIRDPETGQVAEIIAAARDISDRIASEQALRASEGRYRSLLSATFEAIIVTDQGVILDVNDAFLQMFGYKRPDVIGRRAAAFVTEESATILDTHAEGLNEAEALRKSGEAFPIEIRNKDMTYQGREVQVAAIRDISVRRRMEAIEREQHQFSEALREIAAILNSTLDLDAVFEQILGSVGRVVPHTSGTVMLLENDVARVVGWHGFEDRTSEDELRSMQLPLEKAANLQTMMKTGEPYVISDLSEYPDWSAFESTAWIRSYAGAPIHLGGKTIGFINLDSDQEGFFQPIHGERLKAFAEQAATAIKNAQLYGESERRNQRLALINRITRLSTESNDLDELLQTLADSAAEIIGGDGAYITLWDAANKRVMPGAAYGAQRETYKQVRVEPGEPTLTDHVLKTGKPLAVDDVFDTPYLSQRIAATFPDKSIVALPLRTEDRDIGGLLIAFNEPHHFTEDEVRWAAQAAELFSLTIDKAQAYAELQARNEELDAFSHTVAHDLKAPLTTMFGYLELAISDSQGVLNNETLDMLYRVRISTQRLRRIIDGLLLLAQLRQADHPLQTVEPYPVVEAAVDRFFTDIEERQIRIQIEPDMPAVIGFGPWLEEVFANLLSNAIKYIGKDNVEPSITVRALEMGQIVRFEVQDNGLGIDPEAQKTLFEMFSRFHIGEARGLGLGLSIVRRLVTRLEGEFGVESREGEGSTFWFALPRAEVEQPQH